MSDPAILAGEKDADAGLGNDWNRPPTRVFNVTPSDTEDLTLVSRAIRANVAGTIAVVDFYDGTATMNFLAGETRYVRVKRIKATGTTATGIEVMA